MSALLACWRRRTRDTHVAGSLSLDFDGEQVSGEFTIAIACVDSRPRA